MAIEENLCTTNSMSDKNKSPPASAAIPSVAATIPSAENNEIASD